MNRLRRSYLHWRHRRKPWVRLLAPYHGEELVSIDLETTGLDPRSDEILSIAAVPIRDGVLRVSERFTCLVSPGRDFDIESIRHHRLRRSEEHTSELQSLMRNSYAVFCLKKKKKETQENSNDNILTM